MASLQWWRSLSFAANRNRRPVYPRPLSPLAFQRTASTKGKKPSWEARGSRGSDKRSEKLPSNVFKKRSTEERSSDGFNQRPDRRGPQYDHREKRSPDKFKNSVPEERSSGGFRQHVEQLTERGSRREKWSSNPFKERTSEERGGSGLRQRVEPLAEHDPQPEKWSITKFRRAATSLDDKDSWEEISGDIRLSQKHFKERKGALEKRKEQASKHVAVDGDGKSHAPDVGVKGQSEPAKHLSNSSYATSEKHGKSAKGNDRGEISKAAKCKTSTGGIKFTSNAKPHAGKLFPSQYSFNFSNVTPRDPSEVDDLNAARKDIPSPSSERHQQDHELDILYSGTRTFRFSNLTSEEPSEAADGTSSMKNVPRAPRERRQQDHGGSDQFHPASRVHHFGDTFSEDSGNAVDGKTSVCDTPRISSKAQQHDYGKPERPITVNHVSDLVGSTTAELRKAGGGKASTGEILHGLSKRRHPNHSKSKQPRPAEPLSDSEKIEPRPWTQDEVDLLHELRHQDVKNTKIAERLGRSPEDTMRKWFDAKKDVSEEFILTAEDMKLIRTQRAVGFTWANIKKAHFPNTGVKTLKKAAVKAAGGREIPRWPDEGSVERRRLEREYPVRMTHEEVVEIREKRERKIGWSTIMRDFLGKGTDFPEFVFRRAYNKRIAAYDKAQRKERLKERKEARKVRVKQKLEVRRARKAEMRAEQREAPAAKQAKQAAKSAAVAACQTSSWSPFSE